MFEAVEGLLDEHAELERQLADPDLHTDQSRSRTLGRRYAELTPMTPSFRLWRLVPPNRTTVPGWPMPPGTKSAALPAVIRGARRGPRRTQPPMKPADTQQCEGQFPS